ncbi:hypothetical protein R1sor_021577 [Riccia sorocarpa]|uniref:Transposase n=1 Tax=Riccia sorocarpa TaxID=122646 RepID=A0ABD3GIW9_9MARC
MKDELLNAVKLLEGEEYKKDVFEVTFYKDNDYISAMGFITSFWERVTSIWEVVVDNTFKTNALKFELFCLVGNMGGFGVPLSYFFFLKKQTASDGTIGPPPDLAQQRSRVLQLWLESLAERNLQPLVCISDKDVSQLNALAVSFKHLEVQLCLHHAQQALEVRLMQTKTRGRMYTGKNAHDLFDFIDPDWGPVESNGPGHVAHVSVKGEEDFFSRVTVAAEVDPWYGVPRKLVSAESVEVDTCYNDFPTLDLGEETDEYTSARVADLL